MDNPGPDLCQLVETYIIEHDISKTTAITCRCAARSFVSWFGHCPSPIEVASNINAFLAHHSDKGSRYTTRTYRGHLIRILKSAADRGLCVLPPLIRPVKAPEHEPDSFSDDEISLLLKHGDGRQQAAILLVHDSGFRYSDVFKTTWGMVDEAWCVRIIVSKSGRREVRQLSAAAVAACASLQVTPGPKEKLLPWPYKSRTPWDDGWRALGKRAGVDTLDRGLQAIRRRASSLVAIEHGDVAAAKFLGHSPHSGTSVFHRFYRVGKICDKPPPSPPPMILPEQTP